MTKNNQTEWVKINGVYVKKSDVEQIEVKGMWPYGHKIYRFMEANVSIDELDKIYREEFTHPDSLKLEYNKSVRSAGFALMMYNRLAEKGTPEQKKYYIGEQLAIKPNIAGTENFYALLLSLKNDYSKMEIEDIGKSFYDKNYAEIISQEYLTDNKIFIERLDKSYKEFKNTIAMK